jgi:hypothetical protein
MDEGDEVGSRVRVESQCSCERTKHLQRRSVFPPLFKPSVVIGAQPGKESQLFSTEATNPPTVARYEAGVLRRHRLTPRS